MEEIAVPPDMRANEHEPLVQLLVADDDAVARSLFISSARETVGEVVALEAEDGAEAIQLGLQQRPDIALLDVNMPRLGGIEAAITLRELEPRIRLGLQTADPLTHREQAYEQAYEHRLPLFSKLELDRTLSWLQAQVQGCVETQLAPAEQRKQSFVCGACGYGALRVGAPDRCPMCQAENAWVLASWGRSGMVVTG
jgi:CheY-like chemotaxis protein